ncbi:MAG: SBBP repeat-containing protein [Thermodesulfobacteriota bacterium]
MRFFTLLFLQLIILLPVTGYAAETPIVKATALQKTAVMESYGKLPLYFVRNDGQTDKAVKFYERGAGHSTFFTEEGVVISLLKDKGLRDVKLSFVGANKDIKIKAEEPHRARFNYFTGNKNKQWRTDVPSYSSVLYKDVYDNVDIRFYGNNSDIEHDVIVRAGGNPAGLRFAYDGVKAIKTTKAGELEVILSSGSLLQHKPYIYQEIDGKRVEVGGSYRVISDGSKAPASYGFIVGSYDRDKTLVIDPVINYSTYLGGRFSDFGRDIAIDSSGAAYITGWTLSANFPRRNAAQNVFAGGTILGDVFVTKINAAGTAIVYSTYLGGTGEDEGIGIALDAAGSAYVTGVTESFDFPLHLPLQGVFGGGTKDGFLTKISAAGNSLVYSTYIGGFGNDKSKGIAVTPNGAVYLTGWTSSPNFPVVGPIQPFRGGGHDAFVMKLPPSGQGIVYSTFLGGLLDDSGRTITIDSTGAAYVAGHSWSANFPTLNPVQGVLGGARDIVIFKINPAGSALVFSTYLGGSGSEKSKGIALNSNNSIYVTGWTDSPNFPVVNPKQGVLRGVQDAFVLKLAPPGRRIIFSTYLGGSDSDSGRDIAVDSAGNIYVVGHTWSFDFPLFKPLIGSFSGIRDAFVTKFNAAGSAFVYSTYLGGSGDDTARGVALDSSGTAYVAGATVSIDFPLVNPLQGTYGGGFNEAFFTKISGAKPAPVATITLVPDVTSIARGSAFGYTITIVNITGTQQCFDFWEKATLPNGGFYPPVGELLGPINVCLNANATQSSHITQAIPLSAPVGTYVLNAFVGNPFPSFMDRSSFNLDVTALSPAGTAGYKTWRLLENGLLK